CGDACPHPDPPASGGGRPASSDCGGVALFRVRRRFTLPLVRRRSAPLSVCEGSAPLSVCEGSTPLPVRREPHLPLFAGICPYPRSRGEVGRGAKPPAYAHRALRDGREAPDLQGLGTAAMPAPTPTLPRKRGRESCVL